MKSVHVLAVLFAGGALLLASEKPGVSPTPAVAETRAPEFPAKLPTFGEPDVAGWTRVNEKGRHLMAARIAFLCVQVPQKLDRGDHADKFVEIFVNDAGRNAMASQPSPSSVKSDKLPPVRFPAGTVIIKVKYAAAKGGVPIMRTLMIKHAAGYNPSCGDWEFVTTDGDGSHVGERGKIARCAECHERKPSSDFTFIDDYRPRPVVPAK